MPLFVLVLSVLWQSLVPWLIHSSLGSLFFCDDACLILKMRSVIVLHFISKLLVAKLP
uniref:Uncharacterized protein n=1 Tax=Arundo donax TaxID=35708 RepID=A0A0A9BNP5_ARUDO